MVTFLYFLALALFMILCVVLCVSILLQESKSSGLGASFGGETTDSLFGASTADVLKKFTAWTSFVFLSACLLLSFWTSSMARSNNSDAPAFIIEQPEE